VVAGSNPATPTISKFPSSPLEDQLISLSIRTALAA
jgi:hypothetical protein